MMIRYFSELHMQVCRRCVRWILSKTMKTAKKTVPVLLQVLLDKLIHSSQFSLRFYIILCLNLSYSVHAFYNQISDKIWSWFWMVFKLLINSYLLIQGCCQRDGCQPNFNSFEILTGKLASASKIRRTYGFVCSILQGLFFFVLKHLLIIAYIYILCLTMFLLSTNVWLVSKEGSLQL